MTELSRDHTFLHLAALLVEKNKAFTEALKSGKPGSELKVIYEDITAINDAIQDMKRTRHAVAV